jgi:protein-S-isoprenylcysteine O-methyltransferase Ste14
MPNITHLPRRLLRWTLLNVAIGAVLFTIAGTWRDPWLWAYMAFVAAASLYPTLRLDDDLARERFRPPDQGADARPLRVIRLIALAHLIIGALDGGRWHLTPVPDSLRVLGFVGLAASVLLMFRAMLTNRFFSAVVRIQRDRGHTVVDHGVYGVIRHPGYAGMIPSMAFSALALGSWIAFALSLVYSGLMLRRVIFEDAFLRANLDGYAEYATRVRFRLIPGVW